MLESVPQSVMINAKQMLHDLATVDESMIGMLTHSPKHRKLLIFLTIKLKYTDYSPDPSEMFEKFDAFAADTPEAVRNAVMAQMKNLNGMVYVL